MGKQKHNKEEEVRSFRVELRAPSEGRTVEGYAALYDSPTDMGWYDEVIVAGAFNEAELTDVRALFNHEPNHLLARTASKTLEVIPDERGLFYRFTMPDTNIGNDVLEMIRRGDISQSSFAFRVKEHSWVEGNEKEGKRELRKILRIERVYDVSPVTYPAYEDTTVAARSKPNHKEEPIAPTEPNDFQLGVNYLTQRHQAV